MEQPTGYLIHVAGYNLVSSDTQIYEIRRHLDLRDRSGSEIVT